MIFVLVVISYDKPSVTVKTLCREITKILNSEENSKRKVPYQMARSKDKTHQRNGYTC